MLPQVKQFYSETQSNEFEAQECKIQKNEKL